MSATPISRVDRPASEALAPAEAVVQTEAVMQTAEPASLGLDDKLMIVEQVVRWRTANAIRRLKVERVGAAIQLTGQCRSFYHKQLAQQAAMSLAQGLLIDNRIEVDW